MGRGGRLDGLVIVGLAFFAFMILNVLKDQGFLEFGLEQSEPAEAALASQPPLSAQPDLASQPDPLLSNGTEGTALENVEISQPLQIDSNAIAAPYEHFIVTQGIHGAEYGHMAIDISAGERATIHSPINGVVTNLYIDDWGNPSLVLENDRYRVELLHGIYSVKIGDRVAIGQPIGQEGNEGNTFDPWGNSCRNRNCGYHTHINVYDKTLGANVNPFDLFPPR